MSALPRPAEAQASSTTTVKKDSTSATLETRQSDELVIAFMGAIGCGMQGVISKCEVQLEQLGYEVKK